MSLEMHLQEIMVQEWKSTWRQAMRGTLGTGTPFVSDIQ